MKMIQETLYKHYSITRERQITSLTLHSTTQKYQWKYYPPTEELPAKLSLQFKPSDNETRSIGIINKQEMLNFIIDAAYAYLYDIQKRHNPLKPKEWLTIQIHNLKRDLDTQLKKRYELN